MDRPQLLEAFALRVIERQDPLRRVLGTRTKAQLEFIHSPLRIRCAEGGNRSGKTETNVLDIIMQARGIHPVARWTAKHAQDNWMGWYAAPSFETIALQAWQHFKKMLLYPGENLDSGRSFRILDVGWVHRTPETPAYVKIRRDDGGVAEIFFKSFDQGREKFQSGGLDCMAVDEECPDDIWEECRFRVLERNGRINISETPINNVEWLVRLREQAERREGSIYHCRFRTADNPAITPEMIQEISAEVGHDESLLKLRLEGYPVRMQGLVYNDSIFKPYHVVEPFYLSNREWAFFRFIDPGFRNCACLWWAVHESGRRCGIFRDYMGREQRIADNARKIQELSLPEKGSYAKDFIDPYAAEQRQQDSGERIIDLYKANGLDCQPWIRHQILAGIEKVKAKLASRAPDGNTEFFVFSTCHEFLRERQAYRWPERKDTGDEKQGLREKPEDRENHAMDCWRGAVMEDLKFIPWVPPPPPEGTLGRMFWDERNPPPDYRL